MDSKAQRLKALAAYSLLKARARAVLGEAAVTEERLVVLARAAVLLAQSTSDSLSVAVRASVLKAAGETGRYFQLLELNDFAATLDAHLFDISKLLADEIAAVDLALVSFSKSAADSASTSDVSHAAFGKGLADEALTSDAAVRAAVKALDDISLTLDFADVDLSKPLSDQFLTADNAPILTGKAAESSASTADVLDRTVVYVREFFDEVDATDGINTTLLTDDGEVMYLNKPVLDTVATSEQTLFDMSVVRADEAFTGDQAPFDLAKPRDDEAFTSDEHTASFDKLAADEAVTSDFNVYLMEAYREDAAVTSDDAPVTFYKDLRDTVGVADSLRRDLSIARNDEASILDDVDVIRIAASGVPPQLDSQYVTDAYANEHGKNFAESLYTSDDFLGEATADDDQTLAFRKNLPENLFATEQVTASMQKPMAPEELAANDSGSLFWTNYCDSTYFTQGYVGQERAFT